jgi:drug/metabolite transporter (DMT)-like permease
MSRQRDASARATATRLDLRARGLPAQAKGVLIVCTGVLVLSPDALLIRLMTVDEGTLLLLRGTFSLVGYLILLQILARRPRPPKSLAGGIWRPDEWALNRPELVIACLMTVANVCFVTSIVHAKTALALVIISSAPAFTTVLSRVFGGGPVAARTWIASWLVFAGVAAIFVTEPQGGELIGALAALCAAVVLATTLVVRRAHAVRMLRSLALAALLTALVAVPFADPWSIPGSDLAIAALAGLIVLPVSMELIWRGPRYISAPEVSLFLLLEAILGPALVWLALGEAPTLQAVLAGALILGTLAAHSVLTQRALRGQPS